MIYRVLEVGVFIVGVDRKNVLVSSNSYRLNPIVLITYNYITRCFLVLRLGAYYYFLKISRHVCRIQKLINKDTHKCLVNIIKM